MLRELHIANLAVIADTRIELDGGLNCFTGATGAGKSLVIGAVEVLLGLRSPAEMLRPGAEEGRVSGVFDIRSPILLERIEQAADIPLRADGGELLLTRRLHASGRTSVTLNGNPITLGMLRQVAEHLIDVHGQHDHQYLLKPSNQLELLDQFGQLDDLRRGYGEAFARLQEARRRVEELTAGRTLRQQQLELYRFQAREIDAAELTSGEYEELRSRAAVLGNVEKLKKEAGAAHAALYEAEGAVLERLKAMVGILGELAGVDSNLQNIATTLRDATIQLEDVAFDLSRYLDRLELDPGELAEVEDRLNLVNRLLNKYAPSVEQVLELREQIGRSIEQLERATDDLTTLHKQIDPLRVQVQQLGEELSRKRQVAASRLGPLVERQLAELGMEKASFSIAFSAPPEVDGLAATASGFDQIEFIARTNPGQLAQPLRRIASGGELSRIMLALKSILAQKDRISVLVFDEIDANVGGRLGAVIGHKLRDLSLHHQVLCITHLPQIAAYADRHLTVRKQVIDNETRTAVRRIDGPERVEELAEMIGGQHITETTRQQARELVDAAAATVPASTPAPAAAAKPARGRAARTRH